MDWVQFSAFIFTNVSVTIACFMFLLSETKALETKIDKQSARTDRLYEMFIDLLKEGKR